MGVIIFTSYVIKLLPYVMSLLCVVFRWTQIEIMLYFTFWTQLIPCDNLTEHKPVLPVCWCAAQFAICNAKHRHLCLYLLTEASSALSRWCSHVNCNPLKKIPWEVSPWPGGLHTQQTKGAKNTLFDKWAGVFHHICSGWLPVLSC